MVELPIDIVEEILRHLPVKPLKRFRCVAKLWHSLIDSERFVKSHLNMSLKTMSHRHLIVRHFNEVFDVDLVDDLADDDLVEPKVSVIKPPFLFPDSKSGILNTCNGLFLVEGNPLIIWNPFTKEFKTLPGIGGNEYPVSDNYSWYTSYGLTYDSTNDDYKVVRAVTCSDKLRNAWMLSKPHIYSLKSNSWKQIDNFFPYPVKFWHANINGALHSLVFKRTSRKDIIVAFSIESESYYEMELPSGISTEGRVVGLELHNIGGRLCFIRATIGSSTEAWEMQDYGVSESWKKILSTKCLTPGELFRGPMKPLAYTKDGHKVIFSTGYGDTFVLRDFREENLDVFSIKGLPSECHNVEACVESLVSLHGELQVQKQGQVHDDQDKKQDNKKSRKKRDDFLSTGFKLEL